MGRISNLELDDHPELNDLVAQICKLRGRPFKRGGHLWELYTTLFHNPAIASAWLQLMTAVRAGSKLPAADQELVVVLLAKINKSKFEYDSHAPKGLAAGLTQAQLDALLNWRESKLFSERQRAILAYAEVISRTVEVPDEIFAAVRKIFNDRELVDLTGIIAAYNFTMRFTVPMQLK